MSDQNGWETLSDIFGYLAVGAVVCFFIYAIAGGFN